MAHPFDALRLAASAVDPDPAFAARLRARIERALTLPLGVAVSTMPTTMPTAMPTEAEPAQTEPAQTEPTTNENLGAAIPYLAVTDARRALDWYAMSSAPASSATRS